MNPHFERGQLLYQQSRYDLAEESFRRALVDNPDDALCHCYLALCLIERQKWQDATDEAELAIGRAPDMPFAHHVLAIVYLARNRPDEAEAPARQAIQLDPYAASYHMNLGNVLMQQKRYADALASADAGLRLEPDHIGCANVKAMALVNLGRKKEADKLMEGVLARDPEDAFSHANQGWTALNQSEPNKALVHFREALRLDPTLEYAQAGMVEALKARYLIYRLMLRWFLWMARLGAKWQWAMIIGLFVGMRMVRTTAEANPDLGVVLWPLYGLLVGFVVLTWIAYPLFNLMLRLNRYGRHMLTTDQRRGANFVGITLLSALIALIAGLARGDETVLLLALVIGLYVLVAASVFQVPRGWPRLVAFGAAAILAGIACYAFTMLFGAMNQDDPRVLKRMASDGFAALDLYFPGILFYNIGVNFLMQARTDRH